MNNSLLLLTSTIDCQTERAAYKKVDLISQEEFDSQKGVEERTEREASADSDLVFALDLPEGGKPVQPVHPVPTAPTTTSVPTKPHPPASSQKEGERGGGRETREHSPSKHRAHPRSGPAETAATGRGKSRAERADKRARFYPVPNKPQVPQQV